MNPRVHKIILIWKIKSAPPVDELHGFLGVTVQNMIDMLSYAERKTLQENFIIYYIQLKNN